MWFFITLVFFAAVALIEHSIFRRGFAGYCPDDFNKSGNLPRGLAAFAAFCFGVMGAVLGMAQSWFTGPIGKLCGTEYGGDVGFELAVAFSAIVYLSLRPLELKYSTR